MPTHTHITIHLMHIHSYKNAPNCSTHTHHKATCCKLIPPNTLQTVLHTYTHTHTHTPITKLPAVHSLPQTRSKLFHTHTHTHPPQSHLRQTHSPNTLQTFSHTHTHTHTHTPITKPPASHPLPQTRFKLFHTHKHSHSHTHHKATCCTLIPPNTLQTLPHATHKMRHRLEINGVTSFEIKCQECFKM